MVSKSPRIPRIEPFNERETADIRRMFFDSLTTFDDANRALADGRFVEAADLISALQAITFETAQGVKWMAEGLRKQLRPHLDSMEYDHA